MFLGGIGSHHHRLDDHRSRSAEAPARPAATASVQAFHESTSAEVVLTTADGDRVTLSAGSTRDVAVATYDASGQLTGTVVKASGDSSFSVQVEGELSAEELRDIKKALRFLRRAARDGEIEAHEVQNLATRKDLDTLAGLSAEFSVTRSAVAFEATA